MDWWVAVSVDDIAKRWRPLQPDEIPIAQQVIRDAQDIVEDDLIEAGVAEPPSSDRWRRAYVRVVATMAVRVLKNPDGLLTETIDDYTYRRDSAVSAGALYVSADELADLIPQDERPRRSRGAFSIVTT